MLDLVCCLLAHLLITGVSGAIAPGLGQPIALKLNRGYRFRVQQKRSR
ncbi:MAG: hypothetical protein KME43_08740 [Myxacorys chilensis ATA2-1-KO14]|nr:hypothetical protein [Myxacorys chilensis ATA2-1-KO14]